MQKLSTLIIIMALSIMQLFAQNSKSIKITEVMTNNHTSIIDEYGKHKPWLEISNISFSTYNIRGMFVTTDRKVLNKQLSPEQRRIYLHMIPNNDVRTTMTARQSIIVFDNFGTKDEGPFQMPLAIKQNHPIWIGIYDGNAVDLIDSVTVPHTIADLTYSMNKAGDYSITPVEKQTPGKLPADTKSKIKDLKESDPHGFGITVLSMGIVFSCLTLLYVFFAIFGSYMKHKQLLKTTTQNHAKLLYNTVDKTYTKTAEIGHKTSVMLQDGLQTKGIDKEIYMAVIALALKEYQDNKHDIESGVITIKPKNTNWNNRLI